MAYPLTCVGGYNVPIRQGKFRITGFSAAVSDPSLDSAVMVIDDNTIKESWETGHWFATEDEGLNCKKVLAYVKGDGSAYTPTIEWHPSEPVKTIYGISLYTSNLKNLCLYVQ